MNSKSKQNRLSEALRTIYAYGGKVDMGNNKSYYANGGLIDSTEETSQMTPQNSTSIKSGNTNQVANYTGKTHEQGGIPIGSDKEVEDGEFKYKNMIFSNRINHNDKDSFADAAKKIHSKYSKRLEIYDGKAIKAVSKELENLFTQQEILKENTLNDSVSEFGREKMFAGGLMAAQMGVGAIGAVLGGFGRKKDAANIKNELQDTQYKFGVGIDQNMVRSFNEQAEANAITNNVSGLTKAGQVLTGIAGPTGQMMNSIGGMIEPGYQVTGGNFAYGGDITDPDSLNVKTGRFGSKYPARTTGSEINLLNIDKTDPANRYFWRGFEAVDNDINPSQRTMGDNFVTKSVRNNFVESSSKNQDNNPYDFNADYLDNSLFVPKVNKQNTSPVNVSNNSNNSNNKASKRSESLIPVVNENLENLNINTQLPSKFNIEDIDPISDKKEFTGYSGYSDYSDNLLTSKFNDDANKSEEKDDSLGLQWTDYAKYGTTALAGIANYLATKKPQANRRYTLAPLTDSADFRNAEAYNQIERQSGNIENKLMNTGNMDSGQLISSLLASDINSMNAKSQVAGQDFQINLSEDIRRKYTNKEIEAKNIQGYMAADQADLADKAAYEDSLRTNINSTANNFLQILQDIDNRKTVNNLALDYGTGARFKYGQ